MHKNYLLALAAVVAFAAPAQAALQITGNWNDTSAIAADNDFIADLGALGLTRQITDYSVGVTDAPMKISVYRMGAESGFDNSVVIESVSFGENDESWSFGDLLISYTSALDGSLGSIEFFSNGTGVGEPLGAGKVAAFLPGRVFGQADGTFKYTKDSLFFGFNDGSPSDADYDDFVIRITSAAVPEPATWTMLIGGFGLVGVSMRRRRRELRATNA